MDTLKLEPNLHDWIENGGFSKMLDQGITKESYLLVNGPGESRQTQMDDLINICKDWMNLSGYIYLDEGEDDPERFLQFYHGWVINLH